MPYVFILGFSRTGSTMLQQILNKYTEIGILPELQLYWPKMLHKDFATIFKNRFGDKIEEHKIGELIELMFSKTINGIFWQRINKYGIDKEDLKRDIKTSDRTIKGIVDALFSAMNKVYPKKFMGAKFPVHFNYTDLLIKWYPNCKLIHTVRDPRAIFVSQYFKYKRDKNSIKNFILGITQFLHVNYSYHKAYCFHNRYKSQKNYFLHKYEDVVVEPENTFKKLCCFLEINYNPKMTEPEIYINTSISKKGKSLGIQKKSLKSYETNLNFFVSKAIKALNRKSMKEYNYI